MCIWIGYMNATIKGRIIGHGRWSLDAAKRIALQLIQRRWCGPRYVSACEIGDWFIQIVLRALAYRSYFTIFNS